MRFSFWESINRPVFTKIIKGKFVAQKERMMKATGIVRRIDELGRVVIPKEIRKTLRIKEGDPLEIYTDREEVLFRKYSPLGGMPAEATAITEALAEVGEGIALVFDSESVISASGKGAKEFVGESASEELIALLNQRTVKRASRTAGEGIVPLFRHAVVKTEAQIIVPVIANGDLFGAVCLLSSKEGDAFGEREVYAVKCAAAYLAKRFS